MGFRIQARTILQLGAELISSDAVAFYELIKNSIDAGAKNVRIRVVSVLPHDVCNKLLDEIEALRKAEPPTRVLEKCIDGIKRVALSKAKLVTEFARERLSAIEDASTLDELEVAINQCSSIEVEDSGSGMSLEALSSVYLTVGTRSRYSERKNEANKPDDEKRVILGEKGIGRLSAMRLGGSLLVSTTRVNDLFWNTLDIDWGLFSHDSDQLLDEISIEPFRGEKKKDREQSGTTLTIHRLVSTWDKGRVEAMIRDEFSKLVDPFAEEETYKIFVRFNGEALERVLFDLDFLEAAHATLSADFRIDKVLGPVLSGRINYKRHKKVKTFSLSGTHLLTSTKFESLDPLIAVGPFSLILYWFNRKDIKDTAGAEAPYVTNQVRIWAGGPMVYRDGFRVNPYGGPDDDWLGLDKRALASGGYKMNRNQLIGKLSITSLANPALLDQTNREGIRDSEEKQALERLLRVAIIEKFKGFLNEVERETKSLEPLSADELEKSSIRTAKNLRAAWKNLRLRFPILKEERNLVGDIDDAIDELTSLLDRARGLVLSYDKGRGELIQLAGIGLMVEFIGHELSRATEHALRSVMRSRKSASTTGLDAALESLGTQLKTLNKRIRVLDPLSPSGRQTKENFDLFRWTEDLIETHEDQLSRHAIICDVKLRGASSNQGVPVRAVKGMVTQIIENLIANSVYWLKAQKLTRPTFQPKLSIIIDASTSALSVSDNGPGVELDRAEEIFQPFVTSKPPGEGKGLGLYIAREMARYHGCELHMSDQDSESGLLHTFVFEFSNIDR